MLMSPASLIPLPPLLMASPCPATEPGMWSDYDVGCAGDGRNGVISEGEENRSASLYLTPSLFRQSLMREGSTRDTVTANAPHSFFNGYLLPKVARSSRPLGKSINKENQCKRRDSDCECLEVFRLLSDRRQ